MGITDPSLVRNDNVDFAGIDLTFLPTYDRSGFVQLSSWTGNWGFDQVITIPKSSRPITEIYEDVE